MQWLIDLWLEIRIELARRRLVKVGSNASWLELVNLIGQRSPRQIAKMERDKGLA